MPVGVKVPNRFYFSAILTMPVSLLVDQRIFFLQKTASSRNIVLGTMCKLYYNDLQKLASTYSISSLNVGITDIKMAIWCIAPLFLFSTYIIYCIGLFHISCIVVMYFCMYCMCITVLPFWRNRGIIITIVIIIIINSGTI